MNDQITMALATVRDAGSLPVTWNNIDECTAEILRWKNTIGLGVIRIGQALLWAKERLRHGEFDAWLRDKVEFSRSSATNFMRIAREVEEGSALARLPYTKVLALLDVPKEEREAFAAAHDAEHTSAAELKRLAKELDAEKRHVDGLRDALRVRDGELEAQKKIADRLGAELRETKAQPPQVVEKLPDDYVDLKRRLAKAEEEADRMADELDQMKARQIESDMTGEPEIASRIVSMFGGFLTQSSRYPQMIRDMGDCVDDRDINLILGQITTLRTWCDALRDALLDQPRLSRR